MNFISFISGAVFLFDTVCCSIVKCSLIVFKACLLLALCCRKKGKGKKVKILPQELVSLCECSNPQTVLVEEMVSCISQRCHTVLRSAKRH